MATIHPFAPKNNTATLRCTSCGKTTDAACNCGVGYDYIPPGKLAERAIKDNPGMSDREIADNLGVGKDTIRRARPTGAFAPVEPRIGKDGKARRMPRKTKIAKDTKQAMAQAFLDDDKARPQVAANFGVGENAVSIAVAREEGRREVVAEMLSAVDSANFSEKGRLKIEDAIRIHKTRLDKQFEQIVNAEVRRRIDAANDAVRKHLREIEQQNIALQRLLGQQALYSPKEFNLLLKCLDSSPFSFRLKDDTEEDRIANRELIKRFDEAMPLIRDNKDRLVNPGKK